MQVRAARDLAANNEEERKDAATGKAMGGGMRAKSMVAEMAAAPRPLAKVVAPVWSLDPQGMLVRILPGGSPQIVRVAENVSFRAVATIANEVWAGGADGALYHSNDSGMSWNRVPFPVPETILGIQFSTPSEGAITTEAGRRFATHNGGGAWAEMP